MGMGEKDFLIYKSKIQKKRIWNFIQFLMVVICIISFLVVNYIFFLIWTFELRYILTWLIIFCSLIYGSIIVFEWKFTQETLEIHENSFTPIHIGLIDYLKRKKVIVPYNTLKRIESEELPRYSVHIKDDMPRATWRPCDKKIPLKVLIIYTDQKAIMLKNSEFEMKALESLENTIRQHEKEHDYTIKWVSEISTSEERKKIIKNHKRKK